jgi:predicted DCC family thiol-disulfide oxidoreductase YuxK
VARVNPAGPERLYYDGDCGLCHHAVRFVVARDPHGVAFRFAPIGGPAFLAHVPEAERQSLPDSLIVQRADGALLVRSEGFAHVLIRLGGVWELLGHFLRGVPGPLRDAAYDFVARRRARWFRPPAGQCPVLPPELRARFES